MNLQMWAAAALCTKITNADRTALCCGYDVVPSVERHSGKQQVLNTSSRPRESANSGRDIPSALTRLNETADNLIVSHFFSLCHLFVRAWYMCVRACLRACVRACVRLHTNSLRLLSRHRFHPSQPETKYECLVPH